MGYRYADSSMLKGASFKNRNRNVSLPQYGSGTPDWAATEFKDYRDISSSALGQNAPGTQPMATSNLGGGLGDAPGGQADWPRNSPASSFRELGNPITLLNLMMQNKLGKIATMNQETDLLGNQRMALEDIELALVRARPKIEDEMNRRGGTNSGFRNVRMGELESDALRAKGRVGIQTARGQRDLELQREALDTQYHLADAFERQRDGDLEALRSAWAERIRAI